MSDPNPPDSPPHIHPKDRGPVRAVPDSTAERKIQIPLDAAPLPASTTNSPPSNVVFLRHATPSLTEYSTSILSCMNCGNKTYTLRRTSQASFPVLQCAACQQAVGRVGWAPGEDEDDG